MEATDQNSSSTWSHQRGTRSQYLQLAPLGIHANKRIGNSAMGFCNNVQRSQSTPKLFQNLNSTVAKVGIQGSIKGMPGVSKVGISGCKGSRSKGISQKVQIGQGRCGSIDSGQGQVVVDFNILGASGLGYCRNVRKKK